MENAEKSQRLENIRHRCLPDTQQLDNSAFSSFNIIMQPDVVSTVSGLSATSGIVALNCMRLIAIIVDINCVCLNNARTLVSGRLFIIGYVIRSILSEFLAFNMAERYFGI